MHLSLQTYHIIGIVLFYTVTFLIIATVIFVPPLIFKFVMKILYNKKIVHDKRYPPGSVLYMIDSKNDLGSYFCVFTNESHTSVAKNLSPPEYAGYMYFQHDMELLHFKDIALEYYPQLLSPLCFPWDDGFPKGKLIWRLNSAQRTYFR